MKRDLSKEFGAFREALRCECHGTSFQLNTESRRTTKGTYLMFRTCQKPIALPGHEKNPLVNTYCQRPEGHESYDPKGKCADHAKTEDRTLYA